jgi:transcriptional regulator with XRE-family HTH domain
MIHATKNIFSEYIRKRREELLEKDRSFSLRQVAFRIEIEPSYLSKLERGEAISLSEKKIEALSKELGIDKDILLALAGKISSDVQKVIRERPQLFAQLIRNLKNIPDHALLQIIHEVRAGK